jgi:hypothetical protein
VTSELGGDQDIKLGFSLRFHSFFILCYGNSNKSKTTGECGIFKLFG